MSADIRLVRWPERDRAEFERLAAALRRVRSAATGGDFVVPAAPEAASALDRARTQLDERRARCGAAGEHADLFGDPAWELLLAAYVAAGEGVPFGTAAAERSSGALPLSATRWLGILNDRGLLAVGEAGAVSPTAAGRDLVERCLGEPASG